ncbi:tRNA(Ile)-lysidine synthase domain protein, partial [Chlamydia psittaci 84-8471/1]
IDRTSFSC